MLTTTTTTTTTTIVLFSFLLSIKENVASCVLSAVLFSSSSFSRWLPCVSFATSCWWCGRFGCYFRCDYNNCSWLFQYFAYGWCLTGSKRCDGWKAWMPITFILAAVLPHVPRGENKETAGRPRKLFDALMMWIWKFLVWLKRFSAGAPWPLYSNIRMIQLVDA